MSTFNVLPFIKTGFWAGVTPCTFTTVVVFVLAYRYAPFSKKNKDFAAVVFICSTFLTYYVLELGVFEGFRQLEAFDILARCFYLFLGTAGALAGAVNMYDWYLLKRHGNGQKAILKFSASVGKIPERSFASKSTWLLVLAAAGFVTAFLSSYCRGYLPLASVLSLVIDSQIEVKTVVYNALYNIMSILPLAGAFYLLSSGALSKTVRIGASTERIISSGVLLGLGCGLLYMFSR